MQIRMQDVLKIAESLAHEDATHTLSCRLFPPHLLSALMSLVINKRIVDSSVITNVIHGDKMAFLGI